jgi:hypothetical protein
MTGHMEKNEASKTGVTVAYANRLVKSGELSVSAEAKIAGIPYARYLQHLGAIGNSMLDESTELVAELAILRQ